MPLAGKSVARLAAFLALAFVAGCAASGGDTSVARVGPLVVLSAPAGGGERYVGSDTCGACHPGAWDRWRATGHAAAFAGLSVVDRNDSSCLRCHVTGYGDPLGYQADERVPDLAAVGCEACHGPGADHARSRHPGLVPTATGGECPPCETNRICRLCHTQARSPVFDLGRYLARVSCRDAAAAPAQPAVR